MGLARMEMRVLLEAFVERVSRFEVHHEERALHNILRGSARSEITAHP